MLEKEPQKSPEHTLEHAKSQNFMGHTPRPPSPVGPTFIFAQGPHNLVCGPDCIVMPCVKNGSLLAFRQERAPSIVDFGGLLRVTFF